MRLVVDNRGLVARLLLLDPTPLTLRSMAFFKLLAVLDRSAGTAVRTAVSPAHARP